MRVLGIIPARYASTRFPGKPLIDIGGKSMIQRVYEQCSKSQKLDEVVVATDDQRIFDHIRSFDGHVLMTAHHHQSGTERCGEVIYKLNDFDVVINIQGDEPLIQPKQIDEVIELFLDEQVEIATVVKKIDKEEDLRNPNRIKVVLDDAENAIYFSRSPIPHVANTSHSNWLESGTFYKHIGIYAWRLNTLKDLLKLQPSELEKLESLEQLRWIYHGYSIRTVESEIETPNIDVPEDVKKVMDLLLKG